MKRSIAIMAGIRQGAGAPAPTDPLLMEPAGNVSRLPITDFVIPAQFWGINKEHAVTETGGNTGSMSYGAWRSWDSFTDWESREQVEGEVSEEHQNRLDDHIADHIANNRDVVLTMGRTPAWASSHPEDANPGSWAPADWSKFEADVDLLLNRYAPLFVGKTSRLFFEGFNEPDFQWSDTMANLVLGQQKLWDKVQAYRTAHGSQAIGVLSPAFSRRDHIEGAEGSMTVQGFWTAGGYDYCDAVAFHAYNTGDETGLGVDRESVAVLVGGLSNIGLAKPVWVTEVGRSVASTLAATELARYHLFWRGLGVEHVFWYSYDIPGLNDMRMNSTAYSGAEAMLTGKTVGWVSYYNDGSSAQLGALIDGVPTLV